MVFGNDSDFTQNTSFAPLANVTVNGCLDLEEINQRMQCKKRSELFYIFWVPEDGDQSVYDLEAGECFYIRRNYNAIRADGMIKGMSSFNSVCILKAEAHKTRDKKDISKEPELIVKRCNEILQEKYRFIGVSATSSRMDAKANNQSQKPAVYVAGVIDLVHNNDKLVKPIEVGNRVYAAFPEIELNPSTNEPRGRMPQDEKARREKGKEYTKIMCIIQVLNKNEHLLHREYMQKFIFNVFRMGQANEKYTPDEVKLAIKAMINNPNHEFHHNTYYPLLDGMSSDMNNQIGIVFSNAKYGQKFNTLLSHKTVL